MGRVLRNAELVGADQEGSCLPAVLLASGALGRYASVLAFQPEIMPQQQPPGADAAANPPPTPGVESTVRLIERARGGDRAALELLCERYIPRIQGWAHGRIPPWARGLNDTDDIMIMTMAQAVSRLPTFEPRGEGGFRGLVWRILLGKVIDELRRAGRHPAPAELPETKADPAPSPAHVVLVRERLWAVLAPLDEEERELVVARKLMGFSYQEIGTMTGSSAEAVRKKIARAVARVAEPGRR